MLAAGFPELGIGFLGVSLAFGLTVLTMAYAVGRISGGHFNPAVSLGLAVAGRFRLARTCALLDRAAGRRHRRARRVLYLIASGKAGFGRRRLCLERLWRASPGGYSAARRRC